MRALQDALYRRPLRGRRGISKIMRSLAGSELVPYAIVQGAGGLRHAIDPFSSMDYEIVRDGAYEPSTTACLVKLLRNGGVLWDVGANTGAHSLAVKAALPNVSVVAFEPNPIVYVRLRQNISLNNLSIESFCIAIADERRYAQLSVMETGNTGLSSLRPWTDVTYSSTMPCWCDTVDALVSSGAAPAPDVVKIDVEGFEHEVITGMTAWLRSESARAVVVETPRSPDGVVYSTLSAAGWRHVEECDGRNQVFQRADR